LGFKTRWAPAPFKEGGLKKLQGEFSGGPKRLVGGKGPPFFKTRVEKGGAKRERCLSFSLFLLSSRERERGER